MADSGIQAQSWDSLTVDPCVECDSWDAWIGVPSMTFVTREAGILDSTPFPFYGGAQFQGAMAAEGSFLRVQLLFGGAPLCDPTTTIQKHKAALSFPG